MPDEEESVVDESVDGLEEEAQAGEATEAEDEVEPGTLSDELAAVMAVLDEPVPPTASEEARKCFSLNMNLKNQRKYG